MDAIVEIISEIGAWITGRKATDAYGKKTKKEARVFTVVFLIIVGCMAAYSIYWLDSFLLVD